MTLCPKCKGTGLKGRDFGLNKPLSIARRFPRKDPAGLNEAEGEMSNVLSPGSRVREWPKSQCTIGRKFGVFWGNAHFSKRSCGRQQPKTAAKMLVCFTGSQGKHDFLHLFVCISM